LGQAFAVVSPSEELTRTSDMISLSFSVRCFFSLFQPRRTGPRKGRASSREDILPTPRHIPPSTRDATCEDKHTHVRTAPSCSSAKTKQKLSPLQKIFHPPLFFRQAISHPELDCGPLRFFFRHPARENKMDPPNLAPTRDTSYFSNECVYDEEFFSDQRSYDYY